MKAVIQRVSSASVKVDGLVIGSIERGYLILLGVARGDTEQDACALAEKICKLRLFEDPPGKMTHSLTDVAGSALVVSQFTLLARCNKGNRPSFDQAEAPDHARRLCEVFVDAMKRAGVRVEEGIFAADMEVSLVNDGPVTIILDSGELGKGSRKKTSSEDAHVRTRD